MLLTSAGVEPATSWSPVGRRIQLSHRGRLSEEGGRPQKWFHGVPLPVPTLFANVAGLGGSDRRPTEDQKVAGSIPAEVGNILSWR